NQSEQLSCHRGQLINSIFTESRRKDGKNIFSIDKCLDHVSLFLFQNECAVNVFDRKRIQPKRSLVTWLIMLRLIICPSSYKARLDKLIGQNSFWSGIISPQQSNARPNFHTSNVVGGAKFGLVSRLGGIAISHNSLTEGNHMTS